jgi:hypothetical protein
VIGVIGPKSTLVSQTQAGSNPSQLHGTWSVGAVFFGRREQ